MKNMTLKSLILTSMCFSTLSVAQLQSPEQAYLVGSDILAEFNWFELNSGELASHSLNYSSLFRQIRRRSEEKKQIDDLIQAHNILFHEDSSTSKLQARPVYTDDFREFIAIFAKNYKQLVTYYKLGGPKAQEIMYEMTHLDENVDMNISNLENWFRECFHEYAVLKTMLARHEGPDSRVELWENWLQTSYEPNAYWALRRLLRGVLLEDSASNSDETPPTLNLALIFLTNRDLATLEKFIIKNVFDNDTFKEKFKASHFHSIKSEKLRRKAIAIAMSRILRKAYDEFTHNRLPLWTLFMYAFDHEHPYAMEVDSGHISFEAQKKALKRHDEYKKAKKKDLRALDELVISQIAHNQRVIAIERQRQMAEAAVSSADISQNGATINQGVIEENWPRPKDELKRMKEILEEWYEEAFFAEGSLTIQEHIHQEE